MRFFFGGAGGGLDGFVGVAAVGGAGEGDIVVVVVGGVVVDSGFWRERL